MESMTLLLITRRTLLQAGDGGDTTLPPSTAAGDTTSPTLARPFKPTTPFDTSMALTILILLTALFFMAFFSVYIRRFTANDNNPSTRRRNPPPPPSAGKGLDPAAVKALPVVAYTGKAMIEECTICLSEFEERECVKLVPFCGHVFHPRCIDAWLSSHVTCPLCRSTQLFVRADDVCLDVTSEQDKNSVGETSTVENVETWRDERTCVVRRTCSCSNLANRAELHRSMSF